MKRVLCLVICAVTIAAMLAINTPATAKSDFFTDAELLEIRTHIEEDADMNEYATVQGACTDGKYAYFAVQQSTTSILKYNMSTWELADVKERVRNLGHANDMTYNANRNWIIVANNGPAYNILTVLDAETLEQKATVKLKLDVYSVAYNPDRDIYIVGISGSYNFAILNNRFKVVKKYKGANTGYTRQGCDCDENYIYFPQSGGDNVIAVYNYSGKFVDLISMGHSHETENLFHVGSSFYTTLHYYGNSVHRIGLSDSTLIRYKVNYQPGDGYGKMKPTYVHYGEDTPLRTNTFLRAGYFFGGWRASRSTDGKYLGYRKFSSESEWLDENEVYEYALYDDGEEVSETVKFGSVTMTPFWINETYPISFDPGDAEGYMADSVVKYDEEYTIPLNRFEMQGYIFTGYTAYRDCDDKYYGYRKDRDTPEWLEKEDLFKEYVFKEGETVSRMTYDGSVILTPRFRFAFTFNEGGTALIEYIGIDENVEVPDTYGKLDTIASGAFRDNDIIRQIDFPENIENMESASIDRCSKLQSLSFTGEFPENYAIDSIKDSNCPMVFVGRDGNAYFLGFGGTKTDTQLLRLSAHALNDWISHESEE